jgi:large subunit ribosomal protein L10
MGLRAGCFGEHVKMNREQKTRVVEELKSQFSSAGATFFVDYTGVSVNQFQSLRKNLRENDAELKVAKVNLMDIAASDMETDGWKDLSFSGQLGVVFANGDVSAVAKTIVEFYKENNVLEIRAGLFESRVMNSGEVVALALLPSRQVLLGMLAGVLNAPIARLARVLNEVPSGLARSLRAVADKSGAEDK